MGTMHLAAIVLELRQKYTTPRERCADHNARSVHFFIRQLVRGLNAFPAQSESDLKKDWTHCGAGEQPVSFSGGSAVVRARKIDLISFLRDAGRKGRRRLDFLRFAIRPARPC